MAQKVIVALEDDLDGGPADETVRFGIDGSEYEIDLSATNARAFRAKLAPFIEHARTPARGPSRRARRTAAGRQRGADVRAWASERGIAVSARGRIPASVLEQYEAAASGRLIRRSQPGPVGSWRGVGCRPVAPLGGVAKGSAERVCLACL